MVQYKVPCYSLFILTILMLLTYHKTYLLSDDSSLFTRIDIATKSHDKLRSDVSSIENDTKPMTLV